jgi:VanZ like protein
MIKANKTLPAHARRPPRSARPSYGALALSWLPALIGMGILFYTSSLPGDEIHLPPFPYSDKAVHFAAYAVLGILIAWRKGLRSAFLKGQSERQPERQSERQPEGKLKRQSQGQFKRRADLPGMIAGTLYAIGDEIHQLFVPLRMFDFSDMAADFLGVAAGIWAYRKLSALLAARG